LGFTWVTAKTDRWLGGAAHESPIAEKAQNSNKRVTTRNAPEEGSIPTLAQSSNPQGGLLFFRFQLRHVPLRNVALHDFGRDAGRFGLADQPLESDLPLRKGFSGVADSEYLL